MQAEIFEISERFYSNRDLQGPGDRRLFRGKIKTARLCCQAEIGTLVACFQNEYNKKINAAKTFYSDRLRQDRQAI